MENTARRKFLFHSSALAASLITSRVVAGAETEPHLKFPTDPRERLAVASWSFRAYIESPGNQERDRSQPGMDVQDFAADVIKKLGVRNIEPVSNHFSSTEPAYLRAFREALHKAGAHVINIPADGSDSYYDTDPNARKRAVEFGKKWVDVAVAVGSPSIRNHIPRAPGATPDVQRTADGLRQVADYAAENGIVVNLENDDLVSEDAFFLIKVIEKVNHPYLHALPDFCNSMMSGNADFNYRAITAMFKHGYNVCHVKEYETDDHGKVFSTDLGKTFGILKASGFRGYCSMEWEGEGSPYEGTRKLIEQSLKYLA